MLLEHTVSVLASYGKGDSVVFERSPADYLAYVAASRSMAAWERSEFLRSSVPAVRAAVRQLDLIVLIPVSGHLAARPGEDEDFRDRVDEALRGVLIDDDHDLFDGPGAPRVVELPRIASLAEEDECR